MKKFFKEFKEFAMRGNVLDMAIGVILATSFGKITTSLINDVLMPGIMYLIGAQDMSKLDVVLRAAETDAEGNVLTEGIVLGFGALLSTIIDFILIALIIFIIVKLINKAHEKFDKKEEKPEEPTTKVCPFCKTEIAIDATRCPNCTSELKE